MAAKKSKSSRSKGINRRNLFITTGLSLAGATWYFSREKSYRQLESLPSIQKFLQFHEEPQVIFIPQKHTLDPTFISDGVKENQRDVASICDFLYDDFGVRALAMEGITEKQAEYFEDHGTLPEQIDKRKITSQGRFVQNILNGKRWKLYSGEREDVMASFRSAREESYSIARIYFEQFREKASRMLKKAAVLVDGRYRVQKSFHQDIEDLLNTYRDKVLHDQDELATPGRLQRLYDDVVLGRNKAYGDVCRDVVQQGAGPIIVGLGNGHTRSFLEEIDDLNVLALLPRGKYKDSNFDVTPESMIQFFRYGAAPAWGMRFDRGAAEVMVRY